MGYLPIAFFGSSNELVHINTFRVKITDWLRVETDELQWFAFPKVLPSHLAIFRNEVWIWQRHILSLFWLYCDCLHIRFNYGEGLQGGD